MYTQTKITPKYSLSPLPKMTVFIPVTLARWRLDSKTWAMSLSTTKISMVVIVQRPICWKLPDVFRFNIPLLSEKLGLDVN